MSEEIKHKLSKCKYYMFVFNPHGGEPNMIQVEKPQYIIGDKAFFVFLWSYRSMSEEYPLEDLVAVGDNIKGTVRISGWNGKFTILNQKLFDSLVESRVVQLDI